ncbi:MAG: hypothetical protein WDN25_03920 [Acetobacteraceae bacterium]
MRVELLTGYADCRPVSARHVHHTGSTVDLPQAEALRLIARGLARPLREIAPETTASAVDIDRAVPPKAETTARPAGERTRRRG